MVSRCETLIGGVAQLVSRCETLIDLSVTLPLNTIPKARLGGPRLCAQSADYNVQMCNMTKIVHNKDKDKDKEKCNCVCETILGVLYWAVGCNEGVVLGGVCGCYEMGGRYDFSNMD